MSVDAKTLSERWLRVGRSLPVDARVPYLRVEMNAHPLPLVAEALDDICRKAELSVAHARELLVFVVDVWRRPDCRPLVFGLRAAALANSLLSLARLLRRPMALPASSSVPPPSGRDAAPPSSGRPSATGAGEARPSSESALAARIPDYGKGRVLTLGERKALARRPTRAALDRLLSDPHPMVIRTLLDNPRVVEDDVIRVAAKRPTFAALLTEVAQSQRWIHRVRVRMAIVQNPDCPPEISIPLLGLLLRSELIQVIRAVHLPRVVRATARELYRRRPPLPAQPAQTNRASLAADAIVTPSPPPKTRLH